MPAPKVMGIYPADSVSEVAQSLPLDPVTSGAAETLAGDVEYRIHLILQEAKKFMVHGKRSTLLPEDVEHAMEALNVEPVLIPPRPLPQRSFAPITVPTAPGITTTLYHVPDDEIDFATYLKEPLPSGLANSAGVKWKAHWLAVEGVQPAIPENPPPSSKAGPSHPLPSTGNAALKSSAKSQLPEELQLYFTRLTTALVPPAPGAPDQAPGLDDSERHRTAALASISSDAAVNGILVYLIKWMVESINKCLLSHPSVLSALLDAVSGILDNRAIFVEPYLHQVLAPIMSVLLTVPLSSQSSSSLTNNPSYELRCKAASILQKIVTVYGSRYPGLVPRITSTLLKTLNLPPFPSPLGGGVPPSGRYEGAILGISALGPSAIRQSLLNDPNVLQRIDGLCSSLYPAQEARKSTKAVPLSKATVVALSRMVGSKPEGWVGTVDLDQADSQFGPNLVRAMEKDSWLLSELLRMREE
ncbi:TATA box binding protein associated factor-domain-containing protein, partial [Kockovaella imperatae]